MEPRQVKTAADALRQALPQFGDIEKLIPEFNAKLDGAAVPASVPRLKR